MKKQEIKGLSAARLLDGLDDDMILSASLPEATPVPTPTVGERIEAFFARMGKGGMAAAVTGLVVAAVLIGILLAGRMGGLTPSWKLSVRAISIWVSFLSGPRTRTFSI